MNSAMKTSPPAIAASRRGKRKRRRIDFSALHPDQNLTEEEVCEFLALCRSSVRNKLKEGERYYDPSFPKPHRLRGQAKSGCAIRWRAGDVIAWNRAQACGEPNGGPR